MARISSADDALASMAIQFANEEAILTDLIREEQDVQKELLRDKNVLLNYLTNIDDSKTRKEKKELRIKIKQSEQKLSNLNLDIRQKISQI